MASAVQNSSPADSDNAAPSGTQASANRNRKKRQRRSAKHAVEHSTEGPDTHAGQKHGIAIQVMPVPSLHLCSIPDMRCDWSDLHAICRMAMMDKASHLMLGIETVALVDSCLTHQSMACTTIHCLLLYAVSWTDQLVELH